MDLDPKIAETIVGSLKGIFSHEINLFDTTGTIIASTDKSRVGTGHEGARMVIRTQRPIVIDGDHEYQGAKHGINVPVVFNGAAVAVIGITGDADEVEPYGNLIRKMTEILLREQWEQVSRFDQRERVADLIRLLCLRRHDVDTVNYLADVLRIDLSRPRRCVVGRLSASVAPTGDGATNGSDSIYTMLFLRFQELKHSFFSLQGNQVRMFIDQSDERRLVPSLRALENSIEQRNFGSVAFGIGDVEDDPDKYWLSYDEANKTADWLVYSHAGSIARFCDMDIGMLLSSIGPEDARLFVQHVFGDLADAEIDAYEKVFSAYTRHNGSIARCAEELYLHKNTVQNRLNKMALETGYNPRNLADYSVLATAFELRRYRQFRSQPLIP